MLQPIGHIHPLADIPTIAPTGTVGIGGVAPAVGFADVFADVASGAVQRLETAEATSIRAIHGEASMQDVVEAILSAEQTQQAAITVRDRIVAAYQEISRMAI
jgi:flagellar hook-basal body complex protein FliE